MGTTKSTLFSVFYSEFVLISTLFQVSFYSEFVLIFKKQSFGSILRWKFFSDSVFPPFFFYKIFASKMCQTWPKQLENEGFGH